MVELFQEAIARYRVLIAGEAGIGKTSLLHAFAQTASDGDFLVLRAAAGDAVKPTPALIGVVNRTSTLPAPASASAFR